MKKKQAPPTSLSSALKGTSTVKATLASFEASLQPVKITPEPKSFTNQNRE